MKLCSYFTNDFVVRDKKPVIETHLNAVYLPVLDNIPWENQPGWGLYNETGQIIEGAAYIRGAGRNLIGQSDVLDLNHPQISDAPDKNYLYCGNLIAHFGHFLISCLSRFWLGHFQPLSEYTIVCHGSGTPEGWFSHGFIRDIFTGLGLSPANFFMPKQPTRFPRIVVPHSCFEEHNFVHRVFSTFANEVGGKILGSDDAPLNERPVWLSKVKLKEGVQGVVNEQDLIDKLESKGVEIIYPERLGLAQQISLFKTRPYIMGTTGSAFHTSILAPPKAKLICLNLTQAINSNFGLIDMVNGNSAIYLHGELELLARGPQSRRFTESYRLINPVASANYLLQLIANG